MVKEVLLSICISSYNHLDNLYENIVNILNYKGNDINVVVVDDNSNEDVFERLKNIEDTRLIIKRNHSNKGAVLNWFETINSADGQYILHMLDRDEINSNYIAYLINIINESDADFGYVGMPFTNALLPMSNNRAFHIYQGEEACKVFAYTAIHPTGFLVKKSCWDLIPSKEKYFDEKRFGIYPHQYIYAFLAKDKVGIHIDLKLFEIINSNLKSAKAVVSNFYKKTRHDFYWSFDENLKELLILTQDCLQNNSFSWKVKKDIIINRFFEKVMRQNVEARNVSMSYVHCSHYGIEQQFISDEETKSNILKLKEQFLEIIAQNCEETKVQEIDGEVTQFVNKLSNASFEKKLIQNNCEEVLVRKWLNNELRGTGIKYYFARQNITKIALYGYGKFAEMIITGLKDSDVKIQYIIDARAYRYVGEEIPVLSIEDKMPDVQMIVVTLPTIYIEVREKLLNVVDYEIVSIEDIIWE